jgi:hypothetical protein
MCLAYRFITTSSGQKCHPPPHSYELQYSSNPIPATVSIAFSASTLNSKDIYHGFKRFDVAPPLRSWHVLELEREEDNDRRDNQSGIQARGGDVVVLMPPTRPPAHDPVVEDKAKDSPG